MLREEKLRDDRKCFASSQEIMLGRLFSEGYKFYEHMSPTGIHTTIQIVVHFKMHLTFLIGCFLPGEGLKYLVCQK
jgi:hypothetical protein